MLIKTSALGCRRMSPVPRPPTCERDDQRSSSKARVLEHLAHHPGCPDQALARSGGAGVRHFFT